jgi:deoxyxylulose-5-phosphate synthase
MFSLSKRGTVVNGFGAYISTVIAAIDPDVEVMAHGVPDAFVEQAPARETAC